MVVVHSPPHTHLRPLLDAAGDVLLTALILNGGGRFLPSLGMAGCCASDARTAPKSKHGIHGLAVTMAFTALQ